MITQTANKLLEGLSRPTNIKNSRNLTKAAMGKTVGRMAESVAKMASGYSGFVVSGSQCRTIADYFC